MLAGFEAVPRYAELVYRLLGEEVEFLPPGFELELDRPEWAFLKRELRWSVQPTTIAAVAAQLGFMQLRNPGGSNRIVTITDYWARDNNVGIRTIRGAIGTTVRGTTGAAFPAAIDTRWNDPIVPLGALVARDSVVVETGTAAAFGTDVEIYEGVTNPQNVWTRFPWPVTTLAPGTAFNMSSSFLNEAVGFWMAGYARSARPEELRL